ncbi:hypothetical protein Q5P01_005634 [Channa striata]|uniref:Uncharacterized protein n=1 Tax=Channa striata TaxID=64152 RepID=A0AA88SZP4_CHASR|nr:hypothetical protein Q5P01_005634 [Channa striata]
MLREEIDAGIRSSLSNLDLLPTEKISAKQTAEEDVSQKHSGPDRISAAKTKGKNDTDSRYSSSHYLKESHQSSSSVTAKLPQSTLKDIPVLRNELSAACPEHSEDTCIWVDSYIFRYIEKFDKKLYDRCVRGLDSSVDVFEGTNLVRICLREKQPTKSGSEVQQALENLRTLVEIWQSKLIVREILLKKEEQPPKEKLIQVCRDVNVIFNNVLYMFEESSIKVVGAMTNCYLFCQMVEDLLKRNRRL